MHGICSSTVLIHAINSSSGKAKAEPQIEVIPTYRCSTQPLFVCIYAYTYIGNEIITLNVRTFFSYLTGAKYNYTSEQLDCIAKRTVVHQPPVGGYGVKFLARLPFPAFTNLYSPFTGEPQLKIQSSIAVSKRERCKDLKLQLERTNIEAILFSMSGTSSSTRSEGRASVKPERKEEPDSALVEEQVQLFRLVRGNLLQNLPPLGAKEEQFDSLVEGGKCKLYRIVSTGQSSEEWYDQEEDELCFIFQGQARLGFQEDVEIAIAATITEALASGNDSVPRAVHQQVHLKQGEWLYIPAHCKHKVIWTPQDEHVVWLAFHVEK